MSGCVLLANEAVIRMIQALTQTETSHFVNIVIVQNPFLSQVFQRPSEIT